MVHALVLQTFALQVLRPFMLYFFSYFAKSRRARCRLKVFCASLLIVGDRAFKVPQKEKLRYFEVAVRLGEFEKLAESAWSEEFISGIKSSF